MVYQVSHIINTFITGIRKHKTSSLAFLINPPSPRPPLPLSATLTEEEAATIIQAHFRGYLACKNPYIVEFRKWQKRFQLECAAVRTIQQWWRNLKCKDDAHIHVSEPSVQMDISISESRLRREEELLQQSVTEPNGNKKSEESLPGICRI